MGKSAELGSKKMYYSYRAAIAEKFVPSAIRNLSLSVHFIFLFMFVYGLVFYCLIMIKMQRVSVDMSVFPVCFVRLNSLLMLNKVVTEMSIITNDTNHRLQNPNDWLLNKNSTTLESEFETLKGKLRSAISLLEESQMEVTSSLDISESYHVVIYYSTTSSFYKSLQYTIHQAVMEIVASARRILGMSISEIDDNQDSTVNFLMKNSMNGVLEYFISSLKKLSTDAFNSIEHDKDLFLLLICVFSAFLAVASGALIPLFYFALRKKQGVVMLLLRLKKNDIAAEVNTLKKFASAYLSFGSYSVNDLEECLPYSHKKKGNAKKNPKDRSPSRRKTRPFKKLNIGIGLFIKLSIAIIGIELLFLIGYFLSAELFGQISDISIFYYKMNRRFPIHSLVLFSERLYILKLSDAEVTSLSGKELIEGYYSTIYEDNFQILEKFKQEINTYSIFAKSSFKDAIFSNLCNIVPKLMEMEKECNSFRNGLVQRGLYLMTIRYWDKLKTLHEDFLSSNMSRSSQSTFLNSDNFEFVDQIQSIYLNYTLDFMTTSIYKDIDSYISKQRIICYLLICFFCVFLLCIYFGGWLLFMSHLHQECWKSKSIIGMISLELSIEIPEIKEYISKNSTISILTSILTLIVLCVIY